VLPPRYVINQRSQTRSYSESYGRVVCANSPESVSVVSESFVSEPLVSEVSTESVVIELVSSSADGGSARQSSIIVVEVSYMKVCWISKQELLLCWFEQSSMENDAELPPLAA
jgi:hypothetical protein